MKIKDAYRKIPIDTPKIEAIYFILVQNKYLYIGQTHNLRERISQHLANAYGNKGGGGIYDYIRRFGLCNTRIFYYTKNENYGIPQEIILSFAKNLIPGSGSKRPKPEEDEGIDVNDVSTNIRAYQHIISGVSSDNPKIVQGIENLLLDYAEILHIYNVQKNNLFTLCNTSMGGQVMRWSYWPNGSNSSVPVLRSYSPKQAATVFKTETIKHHQTISNIYDIIFGNGGSKWKSFVLKYIPAPTDIPNWDQTWNEFISSPETFDYLFDKIANSFNKKNFIDNKETDSQWLAPFLATKNLVLQRIFTTNNINGEYIQSNEINIEVLQQYVWNAIANRIFNEFNKAKKDKQNTKDLNIKMKITQNVTNYMSTNFIPVNVFVILNWKNARAKIDNRNEWFLTSLNINLTNNPNEIITHKIRVSIRVLCNTVSKVASSFNKLMALSLKNEKTAFPQDADEKVVFSDNLPSSEWLSAKVHKKYENLGLTFAYTYYDWLQFYRKAIATIKSLIGNPLIHASRTSIDVEGKIRITQGYLSYIDNGQKAIFYKCSKMIVNENYIMLSVY